jgi:oxygen-independent coproporphyrinogen-3 oxidase
VPAVDLPFEFLLNALRLVDGFDEEAFEARTGLAFSIVSATVVEAQRKGLLESDAPAHWRPSAEGQRFLNDLQALFLPETPPTAPAGESNTPAASKSAVRSSPAT